MVASKGRLEGRLRIVSDLGISAVVDWRAAANGNEDKQDVTIPYFV